MIAVQEARSIIQQHVLQLGKETVKLNLYSFLISNLFLGYLLAKGCLLRFKTS